MRRALQVARRLPDPGAGDPPVGAVVYDSNGNEIAAAHHNRERAGDPTAYAEILALRQAGLVLGTWRLRGCTLVTTLEPGVMAAGAIVLARISRLVIGSWDPRDGAICSQWDLVRDGRLNHYVEVYPEVLVGETDALLKDHFDVAQPLPRPPWPNPRDHNCASWRPACRQGTGTAPGGHITLPT
jgi:tRNA(adenine34) deaminase